MNVEMTRNVVSATAIAGIACIAMGGACGSDATETQDASVPVDGPSADSPEHEAGPCGDDDVLLSAELVDMDHGTAAPAATMSDARTVWKQQVKSSAARFGASRTGRIATTPMDPARGESVDRLGDMLRRQLAGRARVR